MKAIIFDFWGTLVEQGVRSPLKQVQYILRLDLPFSEFIVRFEKAFFTEMHTDLKSGFAAVYKEFGVNPPPFVMEKLIGMWNKNRLLAQPYEDTLAMLKELKNDYKIALLSNTDGFSVPTVLEKFEMEPLFNYSYLSYKEGMLKLDPKSIEKILSKLGVEKADAVIVGDSLESDIKSAENAGVRGILMDRNDKRDYPGKVRNLQELKELLSQ